MSLAESRLLLRTLLNRWSTNDEWLCGSDIPTNFLKISLKNNVTRLSLNDIYYMINPNTQRNIMDSIENLHHISTCPQY